MSDLPASYAVPQYASKDLQRPSNGKIKLKVPLAHQSPPQTSTSTTATSPSQPRTTSLMLKVPAKESRATQTRTVSPGPVAGPSTSSASTTRHPVQAMPKHHLQQHKVANIPPIITPQVNHIQSQKRRQRKYADAGLTPCSAHHHTDVSRARTRCTRRRA